MDLKEQAAAKALEYVESDMILGLGSGSTAAKFVELLGDKMKKSELTNIVGVSTSEGTEELAKNLSIPLSSLNEQEKIDLAIDGADEVDSELHLIKGLGRALLREKVTEIHAEKFICIVDESKIVKKLGTKGPLPVEIVPFAYQSHIRWMDSLDGCRAEHWLEEDGSPATTDNGNFLAKLWFDGGIDDPYILADMLSIRPGIVEHGLFLDMANIVVVAKEGGCEVLDRK